MLKAALPIEDPSLERTFRGHKDGVTALSFRPDTKQLASASFDNSVMLWNYKAGLRAFRFVGHTGPVYSVDFAPSGALLASASRDKTVRLWTPNVKGDVTVFKAHTATVRGVQFSPDNAHLVTCSDDKTIKIWTVHRTKFQYTLAGHLNWVRSVQYSPDGQLIVSGSDDKMVKLWDLRSRCAMQTYYDHSGIVTSVAFHPSGNIVASGSNDRAINLWDLRTHKLIQHYRDAHGTGSNSPGIDGTIGSGGVNSVAFGGPGGEYLISSGGDNLIKIYDLKEGHIIFTLHAHSAATTAAVFSPDSVRFATGGMDATVFSWKSNFDPALEDPATRRCEAHTSHFADGDRTARRNGQVIPVPLRSWAATPAPVKLKPPLSRSPTPFAMAGGARPPLRSTSGGPQAPTDAAAERSPVEPHSPQPRKEQQQAVESTESPSGPAPDVLASKPGPSSLATLETATAAGAASRSDLAALRKEMEQKIAEERSARKKLEAELRDLRLLMQDEFKKLRPTLNVS